MSTSIKFDVEGLIKDLNVLEKSTIPKAAEQALRSFSFDVRKLIQDEMRKEYESPSAYTLGSPYFRQDGLTLTVGISDRSNGALSPSGFLNPTFISRGSFRKPAAATSLDGAILARFGIKELAVPVESSRAGSQFLNSKGALRSRKVQYLLDQLDNPGSGRESYFVIKPGSGSHLSPGIFRRYVKGDISMAFKFANQQSTPSIDFDALVIKAAEERLPKLIESKLSRLLR